MNREGAKEASENEERSSGVFSDASQSGTLKEYEFFVPEAGAPDVPFLKHGDKKKEDRQKSELIDFFLND